MAYRCLIGEGKRRETESILLPWEEKEIKKGVAKPCVLGNCANAAGTNGEEKPQAVKWGREIRLGQRNLSTWPATEGEKRVPKHPGKRPIDRAKGENKKGGIVKRMERDVGRPNRLEMREGREPD